MSDAHGRDHVTEAELALDRDGKIRPAGPHTIANHRRLSVDLRLLRADLPLRHAAVGPVRHPGHLCRGQGRLHQHRAGRRLSRRRPAGSHLRARALVETAARELGIDPAEIRRRNFIKPDAFPYQTPVALMSTTAATTTPSLDEALELATTRASRAPQAASEANGKLRGIGFSTYIEACGIAPSNAVGSLGAGVGLWESAEVRFSPTGSVEVSPAASHGQGHETTFAQLVSEKLGIPFENIDRPRRHRQGPVRHGHLRLALAARSAARRS
jgi:aerobic carbon-monoxide dehydrogenase large subunit